MHFNIIPTRLTVTGVNHMGPYGRIFTHAFVTFLNNTLENQHDMADEYQRIKDEIVGIKRDPLIARAASK